MKKKLLFTVQDFNRGGIPRVMLDLLSQIEQDKYEIYLFCGNPVGIYSSSVPAGVTLLKRNIWLRAIMCNLKHEVWWFAIFALLVKVIRKIVLRVLKRDVLDALSAAVRSRLTGFSFDVAWACMEGMPTEWIPENSARKVVWIHNNYKFDCARGDLVSKTDFQKFDKVICVSKTTGCNFLSVYGELAEKTDHLYNLIDVCGVTKLAEEPISGVDISEECFTILSVGRFAWQKHFDIIPEIASVLRERNCCFKWYIIGNGGVAETEIIREAIRRFHVEDTVILLGEQSNPYKFMKRSSLFALTSRYESYPTVINEAKVLQIPVISTDFDGVGEIMDERYGIVSSIEKFADHIEKLINDPELLEKFKKPENKFIPDTKGIMKKFYEIIEN